MSTNNNESKSEDIDELLSQGGIRSFRLFSNKQKDMVKNINENVDKFISEYNRFFFGYFFSNIFNQMETASDENCEKKHSIMSNYNEQIEEMEKLMGYGNVFIKFNFKMPRKNIKSQFRD